MGKHSVLGLTVAAQMWGRQRSVKPSNCCVLIVLSEKKTKNKKGCELRLWLLNLSPLHVTLWYTESGPTGGMGQILHLCTVNKAVGNQQACQVDGLTWIYLEEPFIALLKQNKLVDAENSGARWAQQQRALYKTLEKCLQKREWMLWRIREWLTFL